jgi:hypothetical protein
MLYIQILIVAFALFAIARVVKQYKEGRLTRPLLAFWSCFWLGAAIVALLPDTSTIAARIVGVGRGADLVIYVSLIGVFYLVFRMYVKVEDLERQITRLVRKLALEDFDKNQSPKP